MPVILIYCSNYYNLYGRASFINGEDKINFNVDEYSVSAKYSYSTGIIVVDNAVKTVQQIIEGGMTFKFAELIKYMGVNITSDTSFRGRTEKGIAFELLCHYIWYKKGILKSHTKLCASSACSKVD